MKIEPGLLVVIGAVLVFYLRLIILQRQRLKQLGQKPPPVGKGKSSSKKTSDAPVRYTILSRNKQDLVIGLFGALGIIIGVLLNAGGLPVSPASAYWWIPTAIGIIAFSWAFKL